MYFSDLQKKKLYKTIFMVILLDDIYLKHILSFDDFSKYKLKDAISRYLNDIVDEINIFEESN